MPPRFIILYEGPNDRRFLETIVKPKLSGSYRVVMFKQSCLSKRVRSEIVREARIKKEPVVCICDLDDYECFPKKRETVASCFGLKDEDCITIVCREMEGWFLAGASDEAASALGLSVPVDTSSLAKEQFNDMVVKAQRSRIEVIVTILDSFDLDKAKERNSSFEHYWRTGVAPFSVKSGAV